ncbi:SphA family protein [Nitrincola schmidtii]|uniref:SphA family protein n=1 Tax=Nitrincola schmidtii TaxID=1730894 RepID=UPI00124EFAEF|nr:transporter [Nitrincola schmidtii]
MNRTKAVALASLLLTPLVTQAGQYVPGIEGVKSAVVPPPGVYYRGYAVHYDADKLKGVALPPNTETRVKVDALANRFIWVTETEVLGGQLGFEAILPMVRTDLTIGGRDKQTGLGDLFVGSLIGWHGDRWDAVAAAGIWSPTGKSSRPADPGFGYTELMLTLGGTYFFNDEKDLSLSALSRYEIADKSSVNDELVVEWGLGKHQGLLDLGLVGYSRWELESGKSETHAVGVSAGYFWPQLMMGIDAGVYKEHSVKQGFEGTKFRVALTKVF